MCIIQQYLLFMTLIDLNFEPILMLCVRELKYLGIQKFYKDSN